MLSSYTFVYSMMSIPVNKESNIMTFALDNTTTTFAPAVFAELSMFHSSRNSGTEDCTIKSTTMRQFEESMSLYHVDVYSSSFFKSDLDLLWSVSFQIL